MSEILIVGAGRAGTTLGRALADAGQTVAFLRRGEKPPAAADLVVLAVPDDVIGSVAEGLAGRLPAGIPVLHVSGHHDSGILAPLAEHGHPTGSLHPLVALAGDPDRLRGAWFAVEGHASAEELARLLGGRILPVRDKALYHAGAVAASNLVVGLLAVAERWTIQAGVDPDAARQALAALAQGAVDTFARLGPAEALTGPVVRGDIGTVRGHLARLSPPDRSLYSVLSLAALTLARQRGLDPAVAAEFARLFESIE